MAATLSSFTMAPSYSNQCGEPDIDSFLDFSQMPSPTPRIHTSPSNSASPTSTIVPLDHSEDLQTPAKPSHEYERFKQQTGLPSGSVPGLNQFNPNYHHAFPNSGTGLDEMTLMGSSHMGLDAGWNSDLMGSDVNMELDLAMNSGMPSFYSAGDASQLDDFVDPSALSQEEVPNFRVYPGVHQQQAALAAKAQAQAQQQRQQQMAQQQQQLQQQKQQLQSNRLQPPPVRRNGSQQVTDPQTEETIGRLLQKIRHESTLSSQDGMSPSNHFPHIHRSKKDEEDMDEDERLLASEEGKKLSSKERRQLRNKVSARAFRSRRKEYIVQLEEQLNNKQKEADALRFQNTQILQENANIKRFAEDLLRHKAFVPYLEDISRSENLPTLDVKPAPPVSHTPTPKPTRKDVNPYQSQQYQDNSPNDHPQIGMALVPDTPLDMSMLNLGNNWMMPNQGFNYQQTIFAVTELPEGPAAPIDIDVLSGKGGDSLLAQVAPVDEIKPDYPVIERPVEREEVAEVAEVEDDEDDDEFDLYRASPARKSTSAAASLEHSEPIFGNADPEKVFAHFELFVSDDAESARLMERLARMCAQTAPCLQRIEAMTAFLDL